MFVREKYIMCFPTFKDSLFDRNHYVSDSRYLLAVV